MQADDAEVGEDHRRRAPGRREVERGILGEDGELEPTQLGPRLDRERVHERLTTCAVDLERLGLPPGAVEREHQLAPRALPERVRRDERVQLLEDVRVMPEGEVGLDPVLERREAQLLEPIGGLRRERLADEIREGRSAPLGERVPQQLRTAGEIARRDRPAARGRAGLEAEEIERRGRRFEEISGLARLDGRRPERLAEPRHVDLHGGGGRRRRILPPQLVDDPVGGHDPVGVEEEQREDRSLPHPAEGHTSRAVAHFEWAEQQELHRASASVSGRLARASVEF